MDDKILDLQKQQQIDQAVNSVADVFYNELKQLGEEIEEKIKEVKSNKIQE